MQTVTITREDWSGEQAKVEILEDGSFKLMGYTFRLIRRPEQESDDCFPYVADIHGDSWDAKLGSVHRYYRDNNYTAMGTGISRDNNDPILAAAKLLCNLI